MQSSIYHHPPAGVVLSQSKGGMVLKLIMNLYGMNDARKTWFKHLTEGLERMGFKPTSSDPCIYVRGSNMIVIYAGDCIILSRTEDEANKIIVEID